MLSHLTPILRLISSTLSITLLLLLLPNLALGQNPVTGAFEGVVTNSITKEPISGAIVRFTNQLTGIPAARRSDAQGRFYQGLLSPGVYTVEVMAPGFKPFQSVQTVFATRIDTVRPLPVSLEPETVVSATPTPTPTDQTKPAEVTAAPIDSTGKEAVAKATLEPPKPEPAGIEINMTDGRRSGTFTKDEVSTLPLGAVTLVRTFDELALFLPGVALPPQTQGNVTGPGVGPGVGSAGQFSVNGLPSRANNFTVDGSDNNDEDIGVRRQGFLSLVPQSVESIQEYQVITLLAPAQFGRNLGAQVNAVSRSGGNETHGTIYGLFNSSQLNAPGFFDSTGGNTMRQLRAGNNQAVTVNGSPISIANEAGDEDSFTLGQFGLVVGGPVVPDNTFYFLSGEGQILNATRELSFAVPTVEERGFQRSGATGLTHNPFTGADVRAFPASTEGDAIFSLFPFPNNPTGVYDQNTFTRSLSASGQGKIFSGKLDHNFGLFDRQHSLTARYNFTDDFRDIPATGGALFSSLRPRVRTQNFSTFLNTEITGPDSRHPIFNNLRASYGRTKLSFQEMRDTALTTASDLFPNEPFLLNRPLLISNTLPPMPGVANTGNVDYSRFTGINTELITGPLGQVVVAGYSPIGVDVFNFPQRRVNNTYQVADTLTLNMGRHNFAFGTDIRRTELSSDLSPNSRPLATFSGAVNFVGTGFVFIRPEDLAATGAATGFSQSLARGPSDISLRYYQLNFFGQDEWRIRNNLSLSYGLRYEYNTPPRERNNVIESSYTSPLLSLAPELSQFIEGRTEIFEPDRNNFGPRVGLAYSPRLFSSDHPTVFRAGYGLYYDQILGAVVSQSRNVFPNFLAVNFGAGRPRPGTSCGSHVLVGSEVCFELFNPARTTVGGVPLVDPNTLNRLNPALNLTTLIPIINANFASFIGSTLPTRTLEMPMAHQYSFTFEQQVSRGLVLSAAYVGTLGRKLLRFTAPNGGPNNIVLATDFNTGGTTFGEPVFNGFVFAPFSRDVPQLGVINRFETTARSRYDALQLQARGRLRERLNFQAGYTYSHSKDDTSDVFDLFGAFALPQNSDTLAGEYGASNFDARHRFSYNVTYAFPSFSDRSPAFRFFFGGLELASTGQFQTGQPFTVNSIFDVNLDGNLTDRLNSTSGIVETGDRSRPLRLTGASSALLAEPGEDGSIGRNTFRAGNLMLFNLAIVKNFAITETQRIIFRAEIFNLTDRDNFGIPVRFLEAPGFGRATETVTPGRRIQFALKYFF